MTNRVDFPGHSYTLLLLLLSLMLSLLLFYNSQWSAAGDNDCLSLLGRDEETELRRRDGRQARSQKVSLCCPEIIVSDELPWVTSSTIQRHSTVAYATPEHSLLHYTTLVYNNDHLLWYSAAQDAPTQLPRSAMRLFVRHPSTRAARHCWFCRRHVYRDLGVI